MVEDTILSVTSASGEEMEIQTLAQVAQGENTRQPGSDVKTGDLVLERGTLLGSGGGEIGTLAFVGMREVSASTRIKELFIYSSAQVRAHRKPRIGLLSTGDELVDLYDNEPESSSSFSGIYDTNRPSLMALLPGLGYETVDLGIVPDT
jgi:gephyrin